MSIFFSSADVNLSISHEQELKSWIKDIITLHGKKMGKISYLFCSDDYLYDYNMEFLSHDTYTDIITFDYVKGDIVSGDIIISVDRVGDNAKKFGSSFEMEFCRVVIHGVLHLLGFKDKTDHDATIMRQMEEDSISRFSSLNILSVSRETNIINN